MYLSWQERLSSPVIPLAWQEQCGVCTSQGAVVGEEKGCGDVTLTLSWVWQVQTHPQRTAAVDGND